MRFLHLALFCLHIVPAHGRVLFAAPSKRTFDRLEAGHFDFGTKRVGFDQLRVFPSVLLTHAESASPGQKITLEQFRISSEMLPRRQNARKRAKVVAVLLPAATAFWRKRASGFYPFGHMGFWTRYHFGRPN